MTMPFGGGDDKFFMVPKWLWGSTALSLHAKALLVLLNDHRNAETGQCNPKVGTLARELAASVRSIHRSLDELRDVGLIEIKWGQRSSQYRVASRSRWQKILLRQIGRTEKSSDVPNWQNALRQIGRTEGSPSLSELDPLNYKGEAVPPPPTLHAPQRGAARERSAAAAAKTPSQKTSPKPEPGVAHALYDTLSKAHPLPGLLERARAEIATILAANGNVRETDAAIRASHAKWLEYWRELPAEKFRPQLWRWLRDGDWRTPPGEESFAALRKPAQSTRRKSRIEEAIDNA